MSYPLECTICNKTFTGQEPARQHFLSEVHHRKEEIHNREIDGSIGNICHTCHIRCDTFEILQRHYDSPRHLAEKKKARGLSSTNAQPGNRAPAEGYVGDKEYDFDGVRGICYVCNLDLTSKQHAQQHLNGQKHIKAKAQKTEGNQLMCNACGVSFSSRFNMEQHFAGQKHKKIQAIMEASLSTSDSTMATRSSGSSFYPTDNIVEIGHDAKMPCNRNVLPNNIPVSPNSPTPKPSFMNPNLPFVNIQSVTSENGYVFDGKRGRCDVCNIDLTSESHARQHVAGSKHQKALERHRCEEKKISDMQGMNRGATVEEYVMYGTRGRCNVCNIDLSSQQHAGQHIAGAKHAKAKCHWDARKRPKNNGHVNLLASPGNHITQNKNFCEICNVRFTGLEPADQHYASEKHKHRKQLQETLMAGDSSTAVDKTVWHTCDICHCHVNSQEQLVYHKKSHERLTDVAVREDVQHNLETRADVNRQGMHNTSEFSPQLEHHESNVEELPPSSVIAGANSSNWYESIQRASLCLSSLKESQNTYDTYDGNCNITESTKESLNEQTFKKILVMPSLEIPKGNLNSLSRDHGGEKDMSKPNINDELNLTSCSENEEKISLELEENDSKYSNEKTSNDVSQSPKTSKELSNHQRKHSSVTSVEKQKTTVLVQKTTDNPVQLLKRSQSEEKSGGSSSSRKPNRRRTQGSDLARATKNRPRRSKGKRLSDKDHTSEDSTDSSSDSDSSSSKSEIEKSESESIEGKSFSSSSSYHTCIGAASSGLLDSGQLLSSQERSSSLHDNSAKSSSPLTVIYKNDPKVAGVPSSSSDGVPSSSSNGVPSSSSNGVPNSSSDGVPSSASEKNNLTKNPFSHYKYYCPTCNRPMDTKKALHEHNKGRVHLLKVASEPAKKRSHPPVVKNVAGGYDDGVFDVTKDDPRQYQCELFQKLMQGDKICFLPTGTGKTLVACMTISAMLELNPTRQVLFVVNKVLLVIQQSKYIQNQIGDRQYQRFDPENPDRNVVRKLKIAALCGGQQSTGGVPLWQHDIIILTAAFCENLLTRDILRWEDQSLVVFDEAHHCQKNHPYNNLLKNYHLPLPEESRCKIVGLTASPAGKLNLSMTVDMLRLLQSNMGGTQITIVEEHQRELRVFQSNAQIIPVVQHYSKKESHFRKALQHYLLVCYMRLTAETDILQKFDIDLTASRRKNLSDDEMHEYAQELCGDVLELIECTIDKAEPIMKSSAKKLEVQNLISHMKCICMSLNALFEMGISQAVEELQVLMATTYNGFEFAKSLGLSCEELLSTMETYISVENNPGSSSDQVCEGSLSPRFDILVDCLTNDEIIKWPNATSTSFPMALVLVKQRYTAHSVCKLLQDHPGIQQHKLKVVDLVGHGSTGSEDHGMSVPQQKKTLEEIKDHKYNIIVATSVAEEGLDLPECELVVAMNLPSSVTGLVQMRGRARKKKSTFIIICLDDKEKQTLEDLKLKEENMIKAANFLVQSRNKQLS